MLRLIYFQKILFWKKSWNLSKKDYVSTKYKFNQEVKNGKKVFWNEFNVVKKKNWG